MKSRKKRGKKQKFKLENIAQMELLVTAGRRKRWECKLQRASRTKVRDSAQMGCGDGAQRNRRGDLIVQDHG
jgi:hypothetical protein